MPRSGAVLVGVLNWVGTAASSCGVALLGWVILAARTELQAVALLCVAFGLFALCLAGVVRLGPIPGATVAPSPLTDRQHTLPEPSNRTLVEPEAASAL